LRKRLANVTVAYHALAELPRPHRWSRLRDYRLDDGPDGRLLAPVVARGAGAQEVEVDLPEQLFPIVADELDLDSEDAALAFVRQFGPLGTTAGGMDVEGAEGSRALAELRRRHEQLRGWAALGEYVDAFRLGAAHVQALAACREELEQDRFKLARLRERWPRSAPWRAPGGKRHAQAFLVAGVNAAVASMSPRLERERGDPGDVFPALSRPPTLLALCGLELFNHLVAGRRLLRCANETCGRLFTMQEGRSRYGVHRTDIVKYHTPTCARAQAQREYRRRIAKRTGSRRASRKGGTS
jgi:hypothetical protein